MSDAADIGGGAAQGAAAGFSVAGPWGAVIGGIIGAVGGIFKSKSKKYTRRADAEEQKVVDRSNADKRRNIVRELYITRQSALAAGASESGGLQSSTVQGGLSSIGSQGLGNLNYFDSQLANLAERDKLRKKAAKAADTASGISSLIEAAGSYGGKFGKGGGGSGGFSSMFGKGGSSGGGGGSPGFGLGGAAKG